MDSVNNGPLVSVIIPTFRRPDTLRRAINSVLGQTYKRIEIIVVDDNNPDSEGRHLTEEAMSIYNNNNSVNYVKHEKNKNGSAARNTGARKSRGEYVAFLDDDDEFLPKKIESQVIKMEGLSDDWGCCYSNYFTKDSKGRLIPNVETREGDQFLKALERNLNCAAGSNLLIRKTLFEEVGGFDESFTKTQDLELMAKLLSRKKIAYVEEPGLIVYAHSEKRNIDFDEQTNIYLDRFSKYIQNLSDSDRSEFYREINKQRFFYHFRDEPNPKKWINMLAKREISFVDAWGYTFDKMWKYIVKKLTL